MITTLAEVTRNGGLVMESPYNALNSGFEMIVVCPDLCRDVIDFSPQKESLKTYCIMFVGNKPPAHQGFPSKIQSSYNHLGCLKSCNAVVFPPYLTSSPNFFHQKQSCFFCGFEWMHLSLKTARTREDDPYKKTRRFGAARRRESS